MSTADCPPPEPVMADIPQQASWISRLRRHKAGQPTDWADLGTAYGLDLSLQASAEHASPGAAKSGAPKAPARRWWQRKASRGSGLPR